jgi:ATP-dependent exoDNAse (exonuclease V) beta subunit
VTIAYTEAAALEMKGRIFALVKKILDFKALHVKDDDYKSIKEAYKNIDEKERLHVKKNLELAYQDSGNSRISTIHSYT